MIFKPIINYGKSSYRVANTFYTGIVCTFIVATELHKDGIILGSIIRDRMIDGAISNRDDVIEHKKVYIGHFGKTTINRSRKHAFREKIIRMRPITVDN